MKTVDEKALEACDKEPIHIPGSIQPFGCLIAFERESYKIKAISANCDSFLGKPANAYLNEPLEALLEQDILHALSNKLAYSTIETRREYAGTIDGSKEAQRLDLFVHAGPRFDYIELVETSAASRALQSRIAAMTNGMHQLASLQDIFELATVNVHTIAEYDRTMFYRFLPDGSGEVVAECRSGHMEPFLGLRYPAWDIPNQARRLYATTPIRTISDVKGIAAPLLTADGLREEDFDLSISVLRATSPIHLEYLDNMGVAASMTIPVVIDGNLWGLITCHNETPRVAGMDLLDAGEVIGKIVSFCVAKLLHQFTADHQAAVAEIRDHFMSLQTRLKSADQFAQSVEAAVKDLLDFDGLGVSLGSNWETRGAAPEAFKATPGNTFSIASDTAELTASNDASAVLGKVGGVDLAGYIEIPLVKEPDTRLVFFRKAVKTQVSWGGYPKKDIEEAEKNPRLSPRKSFAKYIEDNGDKCDEWTAEDIQLALDIQRECAASQSTAGRILQQKDNLRILADELNHRVKNILALVKSLSSHARDTATSQDDYAESLERRLFSLAASHDMLTRAEMKGVSLRALIGVELEPFLSEPQIHEAVSGPDVLLTTDAVPMATLLLHELASNAAKHGALSVKGGRIEVNWLIAGPSFIFHWKEHGGPEVQEPDRQGFGMELLREAIPFEFNGSVELTFAKTGFEAVFNLPAEPFLEGSGSNDTISEDKSGGGLPQKRPELSRALIVEDSYLLAIEHSKILKRFGFKDVDLASTVGAAITIIEEAPPEFALLDINLRDEMSFAIADALIDRGIPFAFVTGYGSSSKIPAKFASVTLLKKPLTSKAVHALLDV